jgi:hypothetical protein
MLIDGIQLTPAAVGTANGIASLDSAGKIAAAQVPSIAIRDTYVAISQVAMLALPVQKGDIVVRSDLSKTFVLQGNDPTVLTDWVELASTQSVTAADAAASTTNFTGTLSAADNTVQKALVTLDGALGNVNAALTAIVG